MHEGAGEQAPPVRAERQRAEIRAPFYGIENAWLAPRYARESHGGVHQNVRGHDPERDGGQRKAPHSHARGGGIRRVDCAPIRGLCVRSCAAAIGAFGGGACAERKSAEVLAAAEANGHQALAPWSCESERNVELRPS